MKFLKDNEKGLPALPKEFDTDTKVKKLKVASFPLVLLIIKGFDIEEGHSEDSNVYESLVELHYIYSEWIYFHTKKYVIPPDFGTDKDNCPVPPKACKNITSFEEIPYKVLFKNKFDKSSPFTMIKNEVDKFIMTSKKSEDKSNGIPDVVNVASVVANIKEKKQCDASAATASEESITNDRLTAFL